MVFTENTYCCLISMIESFFFCFSGFHSFWHIVNMRPEGLEVSKIKRNCSSSGFMIFPNTHGLLFLGLYM